MRHELQDLAHQIVKQSRGVSVRFGCTNGRPCLHLKSRGESETIYSTSEWAAHRWNTANHRTATLSPFATLKEAVPA